MECRPRSLAVGRVLPHGPANGVDEVAVSPLLPAPRIPARVTMPVSYEFDGRIVALRLTGRYETADVRTAIRAAAEDPRCPRAVGLLFDIRGSRSIAERTAAEVRTMAQFIATMAAHFNRRLALLADTDAAFGLMRLGAVAVEQQGVEASVFRDAAAAEEWLTADGS
jgi:hypothetical protein